MVCPSSQTDPRLGGSKPPKMRSKVLLPLPEGPSMQINWCASIEKETRSRAWNPPVSLGKTAPKASAWMMGLLDEVIAKSGQDVEWFRQETHSEQKSLHIFPGGRIGISVGVYLV